MQSQGSTSSQPSFDSLSSSDSLLLSDSDQVEDDTDVFLTDSSSSGRAAASGDAGSESPGSQWTCDASTDKEEEEESYRPRSGVKGGAAGLEEEASHMTKSEGDLLFAQKCAELQGFIRPLLELLNGLKKGRFERGLSSFQQSVAMDRIQRIVGVLQKPDIGGKYLNTLLQVEMMLKMWFPHIPTRSASTASTRGSSSALSHQGSSTSTPPHKHRDQLHIPVKKRRLSWTGADAAPPLSGLLRSSRNRAEGKRMKADQDDGHTAPPPPPLTPSLPPSTSSTPPSDQNVATKSPECDVPQGKDSDAEERAKASNHNAGQSLEPRLTWVHVAPILSPGKTCPSHEAPAPTGNGDGGSETPTPVSPCRRGSPATQDSSISSTTPPKNLTKPHCCQSQPAAGQQRETEREGETERETGAAIATAVCQDQQPSTAPVALDPSPGVGPAP